MSRGDITTPDLTTLRHPLGLPAGSVRSLLALMVIGLICGLLVLSSYRVSAIRIPPYLIYLLFLILGSFFAAAGRSMDRRHLREHAPLYLGYGTVRVVLFLGLVAVLIWKVITDPQGWEQQIDASVDAVKEQPFLPLVILAGFFVGVAMQAIVGRDCQSIVYQDFLAWVSLLAVIGLVASILIELVINPSLERGNLNLPSWDALLAAIVAFYFGARS